MTFRRTIALIAVLAVAFAGLGVATAKHKVIKGEAIYYANKYDGEPMACGPKYRKWKMVAAHRHLPCGTRLKVRNRSNGRVVKVRVQDRGPYGDPDTVLDLSRKAARKLGFISAGRTKIRAVVLHD